MRRRGVSLFVFVIVSVFVIVFVIVNLYFLVFLSSRPYPDRDDGADACFYCELACKEKAYKRGIKDKVSA